MFDLKPVSREAVPAALAKAERYRLLNEPLEAESICRDVLKIEPSNQQALVILLLALTDQFGAGGSVARAQELVPQLDGDYERAYYAGIICERWGKAQFDEDAPGHVVYDWLRLAMDWYDKAEPLGLPGNDDAILRWNACARFIEHSQQIRPYEAEVGLANDFGDGIP